MNQVTKIEIPVQATTAAALADQRRLEAVGRLVDRLVRTGPDDPLVGVLERSASEARAAGLTDADIAAELDAYNTERRS